MVFDHKNFHFAMSNGYETVKLVHEIIDGPSYVCTNKIENNVNPDFMASSEASKSGSTVALKVIDHGSAEHGF